MVAIGLLSLSMHVIGQWLLPAVSRLPGRMLKASQEGTDSVAVTLGLAAERTGERSVPRQDPIAGMRVQHPSRHRQERHCAADIATLVGMRVGGYRNIEQDIGDIR